MKSRFSSGDGGEVDELVAGELANHEVQVFLGEGDGALADLIHAHNKGQGNRAVQHTGGLKHIEHVLHRGGLEALQLGLDAHVLHHLGVLQEEFTAPLVHEGAAVPAGGDQGAVQRAHIGFDQIGVVQQLHAVLRASTGTVGGGGGVLGDDVALGTDLGADLIIDVGIIGGDAILVPGVNVDDGGAGVRELKHF